MCKTVGVSVAAIVLGAIVMLAAVVLSGVLLLNAYADDPAVSVTLDYDIATVLGALMGGTGIAVFGGTYAIGKFLKS